MMYLKVLICGDEDSAEKILEAPLVSEVKQLGREVQGFTNGLWDLYKERVVVDGTYYKFTKCVKKGIYGTWAGISLDGL